MGEGLTNAGTTKTRMVDGFPLKDRKNVRKIINICAHIFINNNFPFITRKDRLSLHKKTSIIIIIMKTKDGFKSY